MKKTTEEIFKEELGIYEDYNTLSSKDIEEAGEVKPEDLEGESNGK